MVLSEVRGSGLGEVEEVSDAESCVCALPKEQCGIRSKVLALRRLWNSWFKTHHS